MATYSFDIFDTCLVRKCGSPDNFFDILARRAFSKEVNERYYEAFVIERKRAEFEKSSKSKTLADIYKEFYLPLEHIFSNKELEKIELECEAEMLSPVFSIKQRIEKIRKKKHRIIFISDMYLSEPFLKEQLIKHGLFFHGDEIYVSSSHNAAKYDGSLYKLIHAELGIPYHSWHHHGDNKNAEIKIPRNLGIHVTNIKNEHSPYQNIARNYICTGFNWAGILAGLSRSIALSEEYHPHKLLYIDVILPFFITYTYTVLKKATEEGINRLFFCARDAYPLYEIALQFQTQFPSLEIKMLSISRTALYEGNECNIIKYFRNVGLATYSSEKVHCGIVDFRTSGKTLHYINEMLLKKDYSTIKGYFWEIIGTKYLKEYVISNAVISGEYIQTRSELNNMRNSSLIYELFFPLNTLKRTINYNSNGEPIYEYNNTREIKVQDVDKWIAWRNATMRNYFSLFESLGLVKYCEEIFSNIEIQTLSKLFNMPDKEYVSALEGITVYTEQYNGLPYVKRTPFFIYHIIKRKTMWRRGTVALNLPTPLYRALKYIRIKFS